MRHYFLVVLCVCALVLVSSASVSVVSSSSSSLPASSGKAYVTPAFFDLASTLLHPVLISALQNVSIPDQSISKLGITVTLQNMLLQHVQIQSQSIQFIPPNLIHLDITGISGDLTSTWKYDDCCLVHIHGGAVDHFYGTDIHLDLLMESDTHGRPLIQLSNLNVDVNNIDIQLSGDGAKFFEFIINLIKPLLLNLVQSKIDDAATSTVNALLASAMANFPLTIQLDNSTQLNIPLLQTSNLRGLSGLWYSNNHFSGSGNPQVFTNELNGQIDVYMYHSFDMSGYVVVPTTGTYVFSLHLTQRAQIDVAGVSAGHLETWNIGMCWPEWNDYTTSAVTLTAGTFYPLRVRYQSGCGGGHVTVKMCDSNGNNCQPIDPSWLRTENQLETPVDVESKFLQLASLASFQSLINSTVDPAASQTLIPDQLPMYSPSTPAPMIAIAANDYLVNSLLWTLTENGLFHFTLTDGMIPPAIPIRLNTSTIELMWPELFNAYPNHLVSLTIQMFEGNAPTVTMSNTQGLNINAPIEVIMNVIDNNNNPIPVCSSLNQLQLSFAPDIISNLTGFYLTGQISQFNVNISINWAKFATDDFAEDMTGFLNGIVGGAAIPQINQMLSHGILLPFSLPTAIAIRNMFIAYNNNVLAAGFDIGIGPQAQEKLVQMAMDQVNEHKNL